MYEGAYVRSDAQRRCCTAQSAAADFVRPSHRRRLRRGAASAARAPSRSSHPHAHRLPARPPFRLSSSPSQILLSLAPSLRPSAPSLASSLPSPPDAHTRSPTARCTHTCTRTRFTRLPARAQARAAQVLFVVGHSEYWSARMYEAVRAFLASGGSAIVLSGNTMCAPCCRACARARAYDCVGARSCGCVLRAIACVHVCCQRSNGGSDRPHLGNGSGDSRRQGTRSSLQSAAGRVLKLHGYSGYHT